MMKQIYSINLLFALIRPAVRELDQELTFKVEEMRIRFKAAVQHDSMIELDLVERELCSIAKGLLTPKYRQLELDFYRHKLAGKTSLVKTLIKAIKFEPLVVHIKIGKHK